MSDPLISDGNSYIFDPESPTEMARLINQDRILTKGMGGPLAEQLPEVITAMRNIVDLGCGPGGWVLDAAFAYPHIEVAGVDISRTMVDYANARARTQKLTNASFEVMDITKPLEFPEGAFDLVNIRALASALRREAWAPFLAECTRILRPGGILRLTELVGAGSTNSATYNTLAAMGARVMWQAGYGFSPDGKTYDMTFMLPRLLANAGYQHIQLNAHVLDISLGTQAWSDFYHNMEVMGHQVHPFFVQMGVATREELEQLQRQMFIELNSDDFCGLWHYITAYGVKPGA